MLTIDKTKSSSAVARRLKVVVLGETRNHRRPRYAALRHALVTQRHLWLGTGWAIASFSVSSCWQPAGQAGQDSIFDLNCEYVMN